jgi:hypothetical protein
MARTVAASYRRLRPVSPSRNLQIIWPRRYGAQYGLPQTPGCPLLATSGISEAVLAAAVADAFRPRWALLTEIALLRQLAVLQRSVARPRVARFNRIVMVAVAAVTPTWKNVLRIVQRETLLRWHRAGFKALWRWRSRTPPRRASPRRRLR